jgi:hypothetical protein
MGGVPPLWGFKKGPLGFPTQNISAKKSSKQSSLGVLKLQQLFIFSIQEFVIDFTSYMFPSNQSQRPNTACNLALKQLLKSFNTTEHDCKVSDQTPFIVQEQSWLPDLPARTFKTLF